MREIKLNDVGGLIGRRIMVTTTIPQKNCYYRGNIFYVGILEDVSSEAILLDYRDAKKSGLYKKVERIIVNRNSIASIMVFEGDDYYVSKDILDDLEEEVNV